MPKLTVGSPRLQQQIDFILEVDKAKGILRSTRVTVADRFENDGEHSWHVALIALVLAEYAPPGIDLLRVIAMLLLHDIVEIDAGDVNVYDEEARVSQPVRERLAADRIYGLLPSEQGVEFRNLWEEFEARESPEARFAASIDRLQPLLLNHHTQGATWREREVTRDQVVAVNAHIADGSKELWELASAVIDDARDHGYLES
ncbi:MAG TPA: phosphohydrolase [Chloroflexi bacterium]|nr:phosphohydrolase [Chloroflexota bacterium]|tara:strand:+ start:4621 stop:5226 length:606 start_codon:yes stop_codon:yes gene_type:complete